jgi:hypothetical protein
MKITLHEVVLLVLIYVASKFDEILVEMSTRVHNHVYLGLIAG